MTTTCGAYHLEALRRQQVIDRKQLALQRLAQKEFGMSWDNPFHPDLRPDILLQDGQPWSPEMTTSPKPFSPDMGRPTTADMMPPGGPMDGSPMLGPSGGGCDSPSELVQPDGGEGNPGAPVFIDVPKSARNGSRLGTPPSRAGSGMPGSARSGSTAPFSPIMDDTDGGSERADSQMSEPAVPPNLQQAARAAGAAAEDLDSLFGDLSVEKAVRFASPAGGNVVEFGDGGGILEKPWSPMAEEQAHRAEAAARMERERRERIEAKHRAQQEHLAALSGGEKRKSRKKERTEHLARQVLSLTPSDQKRLYSVLKEEMSHSARAKAGHKNFRTQDSTGVHPAVLHELKKKEKHLRDNNLTMGHWSHYVD